MTPSAYDPRVMSKLLLIESNYLELLTDDDPMLYTGTSSFGNRVIGSIVEDNDEDQFLRYFHVLASDKLYAEFITGRTSLYKVFEETEIVYLIDFNYDRTLKGIIPLRFNEIPNQWMPLENSYCPDFCIPTTLEFSTSLKGGIADDHKARPKDALIFNEFASTTLNNVLRPLGKLEYNLGTYYKPASAGSYKLDFQIVVENVGQSQVSLTDNDIDGNVLSIYIGKYLDTVFNKLPDDNKNTQITETEIYTELLESLNDVYENNYSVINDDIAEVLNKSLITIIKQSEKLSQSVGVGFHSMEFNIYDENQDSFLITSLEKDYFKRVSKFIPDDLLEEEDLVTSYRILVYDMNTESLHCKAHAYFKDEDGNDKTEKVTILHKLNYLDHTPYSKSLNDKTSIEVQGIGKYNNNGKLKEIEIID